VIDASAETLADGSASGVLFDHADAERLVGGVKRALELYAHKPTRSLLRRSGMKRDFSWTVSAQRYLDLYRELCERA